MSKLSLLVLAGFYWTGSPFVSSTGVFRPGQQTSYGFPSSNDASDDGDSSSFGSAVFGPTSQKPFGNTGSKDTSSGGFGSFSGLTLDEQAIVDHFNDWYAMETLTDSQRGAHIRNHVIDDFTCTFPGDNEVHGVDECIAVTTFMYYIIADTPGNAFTLDLKKPDVALNIGELNVTAHFDGTILNQQVHRFRSWKIDYIKGADDTWKATKRTVAGDDPDQTYSAILQHVINYLRDAIISTKQHYPSYNPVVIVGGSAVAGFVGIIAVGAWILRKRRSYRKVGTITEV